LKVKVIEEAGYESAMLGISLSYNSTPERSKTIAPSLAHKNGGHSKFLESMMIWIEVDFPRDMWSESDTYRISTKQSESTMHTLNKRHLTQNDFDKTIPDKLIEIVNEQIDLYNQKKIGIDELKHCLPEGFLQKRIWCMSYKTFQNIYNQRKNHRMPQWNMFLYRVLSEIQHPEFIVKQVELEKESLLKT